MQHNEYNEEHDFLSLTGSPGCLALSSPQPFRATCLMMYKVFSARFDLLLGTIKFGFGLERGVVRDLHKNATYLGVVGQAALFARRRLFVRSVTGQRLKFYDSMHGWVNKPALGAAVTLMLERKTEHSGGKKEDLLSLCFKEIQKWKTNKKKTRVNQGKYTFIL